MKVIGSLISHLEKELNAFLVFKNHIGIKFVMSAIYIFV